MLNDRTKLTVVMRKVLYIAGYGRSGSTILDILLGNHPAMVSIGEATYLLDDWRRPGRRCACGQPYPDCPFWGALFEETTFSEALPDQVRGIEHRRRGLSTLLGHPARRKREPYRAFANRMFQYVRQTSGKPVVVDSSKSARDAAWRCIALSEVADQDVYVLHLVRSGVAAVASTVQKGRNWALEGHEENPTFLGGRTTVGWTVANAIVSALGRCRLPRERYLRLCFEELTACPRRVIERIGAFIGEDTSDLARRIAAGEAFSVGHNVGGNRLRKKDAVRLRQKGAAKAAGEDLLSRRQRLLFRAVGGWLQRRYYG